MLAFIKPQCIIMTMTNYSLLREAFIFSQCFSQSFMHGFITAKLKSRRTWLNMIELLSFTNVVHIMYWKSMNLYSTIKNLWTFRCCCKDVEIIIAKNTAFETMIHSVEHCGQLQRHDLVTVETTDLYYTWTECSRWKKCPRRCWRISELKICDAPVYDAAGNDYVANAHARGSTSSAMTLRRGVVAWFGVVVESQRCSSTSRMCSLPSTVIISGRVVVDGRVVKS